MNTVSLDGSSLANCRRRLEYGNGVFYPETDCDSGPKVGIYNHLMYYAMQKKKETTTTQERS